MNSYSLGMATWSVSYKQYLRDEDGRDRTVRSHSPSFDGIYTQQGTDDIVKCFGGAGDCTFPKPVRLLQSSLSCGSRRGFDALVLDFFAGSGTTAQAVLEANQMTSVNRRFIMVQLPEP